MGIRVISRKKGWQHRVSTAERHIMGAYINRIECHANHSVHKWMTGLSVAQVLAT